MTTASPDGRRRPPGRGDHRRGEEVQGRLHRPSRGNPPLNEDGMFCIHGGRPFVEVLKETCADAKAIISRAPARLRLRCRPPSRTRPGDPGASGDHQQADRPRARLSADRRGDDRCRHLHARQLRPHPRFRPPGPAEDVLRPAHPRQVLPPPATSTPASSSRTGTTKPRARATASTRWAARADHLQRLLVDALERRRLWPVQSGHGCIGCSEDGFWDNGSFYDRVTDIHQFGVGQCRQDRRDGRRRVGAAIAAHAAVTALARPLAK